jgi:hypothetical protein
VREIYSRFSRGMSTPAIRAMFLFPVLGFFSALPLLVAGVLADDLHATVPADDSALLAHLLDARSDLHDWTLTCIDT